MNRARRATAADDDDLAESVNVRPVVAAGDVWSWREALAFGAVTGLLAFACSAGLGFVVIWLAGRVAAILAAAVLAVGLAGTLTWKSQSHLPRLTKAIAFGLGMSVGFGVTPAGTLLVAEGIAILIRGIYFFVGGGIAGPLMAGIVWALRRGIRGAVLIQDGATCPACGYCLLGNTTGICPECGHQYSPDEMSVRARRLARFARSDR